MRFTFISCSQKLQVTYLCQRAHCASSNNPVNLWSQQTGFPGHAEKMYTSVQWKWKWFHHFLMSRTSLSLGRKNAPRVEVEVYRPKRAAEGWEDVWMKNGVPNPIAEHGWWKSLHTAGCWGLLPRGPEQGKGGCASPGFYSHMESQYSLSIKTQHLTLEFFMS